VALNLATVDDLAAFQRCKGVAAVALCGKEAFLQMVDGNALFVAQEELLLANRDFAYLADKVPDKVSDKVF